MELEVILQLQMRQLMQGNFLRLISYILLKSIMQVHEWDLIQLHEVLHHFQKVLQCLCSYLHSDFFISISLSLYELSYLQIVIFSHHRVSLPLTSIEVELRIQLFYQIQLVQLLLHLSQ